MITNKITFYYPPVNAIYNVLKLLISLTPCGKSMGKTPHQVKPSSLSVSRKPQSQTTDPTTVHIELSSMTTRLTNNKCYDKPIKHGDVAKTNPKLTLEDHMALTLMISLTTLLLERTRDVDSLSPSFSHLNHSIYKKSLHTLQHHQQYHGFFDQYKGACDRYVKINQQHGTPINHPVPGVNTKDKYLPTTQSLCQTI